MIASLASGEAFHKFADGVGFARRQQQVNVIGHETVRVHLNAVFGFELLQCSKVTLVVLHFGEDNLAIVAALYDVVRIVW